MALLHPDFLGHVTEGLPAGLGGTYRGPEAMLRDCWLRAAEIFQARPDPEQFFESDGGWQLVELWQVTDSARWEQARV